MFLVATFKIGQTEARGHVLNLSRGGAMAHCTQPPRVGDWVSLACGANTASGLVRWVDDKRRFGIQFKIKISQQILDDIQQEVRRRDNGATP